MLENTTSAVAAAVIVCSIGNGIFKVFFYIVVFDFALRCFNSADLCHCEIEILMFGYYGLQHLCPVVHDCKLPQIFC